jgi:hypothetical protein
MASEELGRLLPAHSRFEADRMTVILAIDPGPEQSAWVLFDSKTEQLLAWEKEPNLIVKSRVEHLVGVEYLAVEKIASYGMSVGQEVFETVFWSGRFVEAWSHRVDGGEDWERYTRKQIVTWLCGSAKAGDPIVRQALIDRFGPGKDKAIGLKKTPGPLYGLANDGWAALAVAVFAAETLETAAFLGAFA